MANRADLDGPLGTETWGDAGGRRAVLLAGITSAGASMWEIGEGLAAAGWQAVAVDLPGHGASGPADSYRFEDVADAVAKQLGDGWDLVVGHSLGGVIATVLLAGHPGFAERVLLIDPALSAPAHVVDTLAPGLERDRAEQTEASITAANPHWHPRTVAERLRSNRTSDVEAVRGYALQNRPWDARAHAKRVDVPVHVLVPTDGPVVTDALVAELAGPIWTFETVLGTTHSLHRDDPSTVIARATAGA